MGPILDGLDGKTLARMSLSTAKAVRRQEHLISFGRSLRHATAKVRVKAFLLSLQCSTDSLSRCSPQRVILLVSRKLPSFFTSHRLFYNYRMDAAVDRYVIMST